MYPGQFGLRFPKFQLLVIVLSLVLTSCSRTDTTKTAKNVGTSAEEDFGPGLTIPSGSADEIFAFLKQVRERRPQVSSPLEMIEYQRKLRRLTISAAEKILKMQTTEKNLREATRLRLNAAIVLGNDRTQPPDVASELAQKALGDVELLTKDPRPAVSETASEFQIAARIINCRQMSESERSQLLQETLEQVKRTNGIQRSLADVGFLVEQLIAIKQPEMAVQVCNQLATWLDSQSNEKLKPQALYFRARAARLSLPGNPVIVEGIELDGTVFNWEAYLGKVVLIDFWATWCGPCIEELPHLKSLYQQYHSSGFEIVGISLDHDRKKLESFLKVNPLPWTQLFHETGKGAQGDSHPMAIRYAVESIPTGFLVDRDGKVISTESRGPELIQMLQTLLKK